jgi:hypothetical protein
VTGGCGYRRDRSDVVHNTFSILFLVGKSVLLGLVAIPTDSHQLANTGSWLDAESDCGEVRAHGAAGAFGINRMAVAGSSGATCRNGPIVRFIPLAPAARVGWRERRIVCREGSIAITRETQCWMERLKVALSNFWMKANDDALVSEVVVRWMRTRRVLHQQEAIQGVDVVHLSLTATTGAR